MDRWDERDYSFAGAILDAIFDLALKMIFYKDKRPFSDSMTFNPFSATRRDSRHQKEVKVKGSGRNSSYLAGFSFFFFFFFMIL